MSIEDPHVMVYCDTWNCGEDEAFGMTPLAGGGFDNRDLDKKMKRAGWTTDGGSVYCPSCSEDRKEGADA